MFSPGLPPARRTLRWGNLASGPRGVSRCLRVHRVACEGHPDTVGLVRKQRPPCHGGIGG